MANTNEATSATRDMLDALEKARARREMLPPTPASEELIAKAEARLGLAFPPSYRRFLAEVGVLRFASKDVFGLYSDDFDHNAAPCVVLMTLSERKFGLPPSYVVVYAVGEGTLYAIDTVDAISSVVAWRSATAPVEFVAPNFGEFLLETVESEIERLDGEA
jgi:SMI1-KNR4 cell-wall